MPRIEPTRENLHGQWDASRAPVLTVDSGETVTWRTLDVSWSAEPPRLEGGWRRFEPRRSPEDDGPALCGPVAVRGAEPGETLALHLESVRPGPWGWTFGGGPGFLDRTLNAALGIAASRSLLSWRLDAQAGVAVNNRGHAVALRPFPGFLGLCPAGDGLQSPWPPRRTGGNLDCRELVAGSTLYLPVEVPGGLVSAGDGHGAQGDGEVAGMALECPLEELTIRLERLPTLRLRAPRADTPAGWITFGFSEDLDRAAEEALNGMLDLLEERLALSRTEAAALAGVVVHVRVTQMVNGVRGVHALLPRGSLLEDASA